MLSLALVSALGLGAADAASRTWSYTYNSLGLIETADGPRTDVQDVTTYAYDTQGHLTTVTNALGHITQLSNFDNYGNPQTLLDANGVVTSLAYTPQGWLASVSTAGSTTSFDHDAIGQITKVTRGDGSWLEYTYDGARRLVRLTNNLGEVIEYDVDPMGNRKAQRITDATGSLKQQQQWVYDELGRLLRSIGAAGQTSQYRYDLNDNPAGTTNPRQFSSSQSFDALDRLIRHTDAASGITTMDYDAQDNLTQVKDPRGVTTTYFYNGFGDRIKQTSADTNSSAFAYDRAGNLIKKTDARKAVTLYSYDALNRLTARTYPANPALNIQYHYDMTADGNKGIGRLTAVQDASGILGYHYDARGNLIEQLRSVDVLGVDQYDRVAYQYDGANQLRSISYPSGIAVSYQRNGAGQVEQIDLQIGSNPITPLATQISYLPFGPLKTLTWGNGIALSRQYDQDYQMAAQAIGAWTTTYDFDPNGNIDSLNHSLWGPLQYGYDALDRLILEQGEETKKTYAYDATGNRLNRLTYGLDNGVETQTAKQTLKYNTNRNRLSKRSSSYEVEVDAAGNFTRYSQNRRYTYDEQGRLNQVLNVSGQLLASYRYNALGQRTLKQVHQTTGTAVYPYTYLYGLDGQLLGQVQYFSNGKAKQVQYWVWLDSMPVAQIAVTFASNGTVANSQVQYLHVDHLNTPRLATNQSQQLIWSWESDAFGVGAANLDVDGDGIQTDVPLRFPGQLYDAHSTLHYNYFRDYDPETGRYVESDPIGLEGGLNTYGYVEGNPVNFIDPLGLAKLGGTMAPPCVPGFETMICSPGGTGGFGPMGGLRGGLTPQGELAYCPIPAGLGRSGALGSAKRDLGIPRAQHPDAVTKVPMTSGGKSVLGLDGKPVMTREYIYTRPDGTKVVIQDHSAGHKFGQKGVGDQGPHFNVRPPENTRTGSVPGTQNHYSW
jgi:RHS repeat-associated protein